MAKRFSELGIKQQDSRKIFNCQQVSITDILNYEIEVIDFLPDVKTQHGEGRYLVHYRMEDGDEVSYTYNGVTSTYRYINATATRGHAPTETLYWQVITEEELAAMRTEREAARAEINALQAKYKL